MDASSASATSFARVIKSFTTTPQYDAVLEMCSIAGKQEGAVRFAPRALRLKLNPVFATVPHQRMRFKLSLLHQGQQLEGSRFSALTFYGGRG
jgi:hypothetical protein